MTLSPTQFDKFDLMDYIDPIIRPTTLTVEETVYFDAEHDLTAALAKAATAATKALDSQEAEDLADATFRFECAHAAARVYEQAKWAMDKAFKLSDEYLAQVAKST